MAEKQTREFLIVLTILCDDPEEDPRLWPYDNMLAAPPGEPTRFIRYERGVEVKRGG